MEETKENDFTDSQESYIRHLLGLDKKPAIKRSLIGIICMTILVTAVLPFLSPHILIWGIWFWYLTGIAIALTLIFFFNDDMYKIHKSIKEVAYWGMITGIVIVLLSIFFQHPMEKASTKLAPKIDRQKTTAR